VNEVRVENTRQSLSSCNCWYVRLPVSKPTPFCGKRGNGCLQRFQRVSLSRLPALTGKAVIHTTLETTPKRTLLDESLRQNCHNTSRIKASCSHTTFRLNRTSF
jgi:hypothetical protein